MSSVFDLWQLPDVWESDFGPEFAGDLRSSDFGLLKQCMEGRAKSVIVEHDYIDKDYRDSYSGFYSKKFARVSNRCTRLHFFDFILEHENIEGPNGLVVALKEREQRGESKNGFEGTTPGFLGSVVLRPTPYSRIGRCTFDPRKIGTTREGLRGEICLAPFHVHLLGYELTVMAFPHQSQDAQVHTCAETALWSLFRYLSQRYRHYPECYPHDIAVSNPDLAQGRRIPSRGLTLEQISAIIGHFGMDAMMYSKQYLTIDESADGGWAYRPPSSKGDAILRLLQIYLQSGMPAIVGVPGHAIVAIGFEESDSWGSEPESPVEPWVTSDFLETLVVNDDNHAPYVRVRQLTGGYLNYGWDEIDSFVVALPSKVFLAAEDAERIGASWARVIAELTSIEPVDKGRWVQRVLCTSSKNYKSFRLEHPDSFSKLLLGQPLPHFIWLVEYYTHENWSERRATIEIALDATAATFEERPFLWIRFPGGVMMNWERLHGTGSSNPNRSLGTGSTPDDHFEPVEILALPDLEETFRSFSGNLAPMC
jgi:hypothetical protein